MTAAGQDVLPGLDAPNVERWLAEAVDGIVAPLRFTRVGRGRSNLTFAIEDAQGHSVVLRRPPLGTLTESAHDLRREHHILGGLHAAGQPVPRPLALCEDEAVTGSAFYVMERVPGVVADSHEAVEAGLDVEARGAAGPSLARTLAGLHGVDLEGAGLGDLIRTGHFGERQLRRWSRQWELTKTRELPELDELTARLGAAVPPQSATTLVHGDYTLFNTVLTGSGDVRAVLDWELSTVGDPVADLAWCLMWWPEEQRLATPGAVPVPLMEGFGDHAEIVDAYVAASGADVGQLGWWRVLSYWKLAMILEGILRRWLDDPANGGNDPGSLGPGVTRLVELANEAAEELAL